MIVPPRSRSLRTRNVQTARARVCVRVWRLFLRNPYDPRGYRRRRIVETRLANEAETKPVFPSPRPRGVSHRRRISSISIHTGTTWTTSSGVSSRTRRERGSQQHQRQQRASKRREARFENCKEKKKERKKKEKGGKHVREARGDGGGDGGGGDTSILGSSGSH